MPSPVKGVLVILNQIVGGLIQALEPQRKKQAEVDEAADRDAGPVAAQGSERTATPNVPVL